MLYFLILLTVVLLLINYKISNNDYMNPVVIFHLVFFVYEIVCLLGVKEYKITLHVTTVMVLLTGFIVMTISNLLAQKCNVSGYVGRQSLEEIRMPKLYIVILLVLQLLSIVYFYKYLRNLSYAYGSIYGNTPSSISQMIELYDTLTKFWKTIYMRLAVPIPLIYRITNPICSGAEYIVLYCIVNNSLIKKVKIHFLEIMVIFLMCIRIIMNGSRSPLLRMFTFILLMIYVLMYRSGRIRKGNNKFFVRLVFAAGVIGFIMIVVLFVMGRMEKFSSVGDQLFIYLGAPIVNLDTFLENNSMKLIGSSSQGELIGEQTFKALYGYIGKLLHVDSLQTIKGIGSFVYSSNGKEIGNVFTMYFKIIYDFGYIGMIPIVFAMGLFYAYMYKKILRIPKRAVIDVYLLIYAYLFNDIVMSAFSTRFYETVFDAPFIKLIIMICILDVFIEKKVNIGRHFAVKFNGKGL